MVVLNFQNKYMVKLSGENGLFEEVVNYYSHIIGEEKDGQKIDLECRFHNSKLDPHILLCDPTDYCSRNTDSFIKKGDLDSFIISKDWSQIHFSEQTALHMVFKIIEYQPRVRLSNEGLGMIHASGVDIDGTTILFPAWRHTGKTNTLLSILKNRQASYLSDDRLWVSSDGTAHGFPLPINIEPYNKSIAGENESTRRDRMRFKVSRTLQNKTHEKSNFVQRALYFFNEFYITPSSEKAMIGEIVPGTDYTTKSSIDYLIHLQTRVPKGDESAVELEKLPASKASQYLQSINEYEWNSYLRQICNTYNVLFPEERSREPLHKLITNEQKIFDQLTRSVPTYIMYLPQEEHWEEKGLTDVVINTLSDECL